MKKNTRSIWVFAVYLGWLFLGTIPGLGKTAIPKSLNFTPTPTSVVLPNAATPEPNNIPKTYRFQSQTVWGLVKAEIKRLEKSFGVEVKSDTPFSGWILIDQKTRKTVSKGGTSPTTSVSFDGKERFEGPYQLTLFINTGREEVPVVLQMSSLDELSVETHSLESIEDFRTNPDKPYNSMVKLFYEKAAENYAKGDAQAALASLRKAEELDPEQPQIQAFIKRIQNGQNIPPDKPAEESGTSLEKLTKKNHKNRSKRSKTPQTPKEPQKTKASPAISSADQTAKADRAYNLGLESYRQEDYVAAKKFWEETLQIDPLHPQAKRNLERLKKDHPNLP